MREKTFQRLCISFGVLLFSVPLGMIGYGTWIENIRESNGYYASRQRRYGGEKELREQLEVEKKKIGLEDVAINLMVVDQDGLIGGITPREDRYDMWVNRKFMGPFTLRHELHHVLCRENGEPIHRSGPFRWLEESNATSYAINGE